MDRESAELMAERGAVLVPTLVTYLAMSERGRDMGMPDVALRKNAEVLEAGKNAIELAAACGVLVGFGSDLMGELETEQLRGLQAQHEVQGTLELLRSLTSRNAQILGVDHVGSIRPGAAGDLVILAGDPFENPDVLWQESDRRLVIQSGTVVS
jgi:imidazolonepropionase-like amidohydrolase